MELPVYNIKGEDTGKKAVLNDEVFGIAEPNEHVVYLAVKQYLGNQRQGTHKSKERSEISGSTKKLGRQKGGGGARHGDIKSPLFHGGARVFGPKPRDYRTKLNKKVKQLARRSALTTKAQNGQITVVEDFSFEAPSTKKFVAMQQGFKLEGKKVLVLVKDLEDNVARSIRNVEKAHVMEARNLNTYRALDNKAMLVTESAVEVLNNF